MNWEYDPLADVGVIRLAAPQGTLRTIDLEGAAVMLGIDQGGSLAVIEIIGTGKRSLARLGERPGMTAAPALARTSALARIIHETWRTYDNAVLLDPGPDSPWDALPEWKALMLIRYTGRLRLDCTPEAAHEVIMECYQERGYSCGPRDEEQKIHPLAAAWRELPPEQRKKGAAAACLVLSFG